MRYFSARANVSSSSRFIPAFSFHSEIRIRGIPLLSIFTPFKRIILLLPNHSVQSNILARIILFGSIEKEKEKIEEGYFFFHLCLI